MVAALTLGTFIQHALDDSSNQPGLQEYLSLAKLMMFRTYGQRNQHAGVLFSQGMWIVLLNINAPW